MRKIALFLAFTLALFASRAPARAAAFPPGFPAADASRLLRAADQGLADLERLAAGLDPKSPKTGPFRNSLSFFRSVMDELRGSLAAGDAEFFGFLDQGSTALGELRVTWARTGVRDEAIAGRLRVATTSYRLLRSTCGREGLRQRQGGTLSPAERRQLQRIQRSERRFAERLQLLRDRARREGDRVTAEEMERFRREAERIAWASADLETYLNTLIAASELRGEWSADAPYVRKTAPPEEVAAADEAVQDLYVDSDIGQVFAVNLGKVDGGGPGPAAGAVQVFESSGEEVATETVAEPVTLVGEPSEEAEVDPEGEPVEGVEIGEAAAGEDIVEAIEEPEDETPIQPAVEAAAKPEAVPESEDAAKTAQPKAPKPAPPPPAATPPNPPAIG